MKFFQTLLSFFRVTRRISSIESKIEKIKAQKEGMMLRIDSALTKLAEVESQYQQELTKTRLLLNSSKVVENKLEETLESLRDELRTASDITIPGLVAANRLFIDRWEAESKIQVLRGTIATPQKED